MFIFYIIQKIIYATLVNGTSSTDNCCFHINPLARFFTIFPRERPSFNFSSDNGYVLFQVRKQLCNISHNSCISADNGRICFTQRIAVFISHQITILIISHQTMAVFLFSPNNNIFISTHRIAVFLFFSIIANFLLISRPRLFFIYRQGLLNVESNIINSNQ